MTGYYNETDGIEAGFVALSDDINSIQANIAIALSQLITDEFGAAFLLDSDKDTFKMTPATVLIDQYHDIGNQWMSLTQLGVVQKIDLIKTSVNKVSLKFKNEGTVSGTVTCILKQPDLFELKDGVIYSTQTISIPAGANSTYDINFLVDHLPSGEYELSLKCADVAGSSISVFYDDGSGGTPYNNGLYQTADGYELEETGYDLWFQEYYATDATFDIVPGTGIIRGEKVRSLDTHVTIGEASSYANRIDLVCFTEDGVFEVIQGTPASSPEAPYEDVPYGYLIVAEVLVKKGLSNSETMIVDQDDTFGKFRKRSHEERLRRLEKLIHWIDVYNSPERIKYTLSGNSFLGDGSTQIAWYDAEGAYKLSDVSTYEHTWTFKDDSEIDTTKSTVNHNDHTNGTIKLNFSSGASTEVIERARESNSGITNIASYIYGNNAAKSTYPAIWVYVNQAGYLNQVASDLRYYKNTEKVYCDCYKASGMQFVERSSSFQVRGNSKSTYGYQEVRQGSKLHASDISTMGTLMSFSGSKWLSAGWYVFVFCPEPINRSKRAVILANTWGDSGWPKNYKSLTEFGQFGGYFPLPKTGLNCKRRTNQKIVSNAVKTSYHTYINPGVLQSIPVSIGTGSIKSVTVDLNINLPANTYYKFEISNNGGKTFHLMSGTNLTFTENGNVIVWRLTIYSTDGKSTPTVSFDKTKGYAIKITAGLSEEALNNGCLVTPAFDGEDIISQAFGTATITDGAIRQKFSRWQWVRLWAEGPKNKEEEEETGQKLWLDIETSEDATKWKKVKGGLRLDDLYHGSVDFSNYEDAVEENEYNYHADTDENILTDTVLVESFDSSPGVAAQQNGVVTPSTINAQTRIAVTSTAQPGLLWYLTKAYDLSSYKQLTIEYSLEAAAAVDNIMSGALELVLSSSTDCRSGILETFELPFTKDDNTKEVAVFKLESPENLNTVQSIGIRTRDGDVTENPLGVDVAIKLDNLKGLKTAEYPFIERYLRMRVCMHREHAGDPSPKVMKVGVIPILD